MVWLAHVASQMAPSPKQSQMFSVLCVYVFLHPEHRGEWGLLSVHYHNREEIWLLKVSIVFTGKLYLHMSCCISLCRRSGDINSKLYIGLLLQQDTSCLYGDKPFYTQS